MEKEKKKFNMEETEKNSRFGLASLGISLLISGYYLLFNREFFGNEKITLILVPILLIFAVIGCFIPTVNYYFKDKESLMMLSIGLLFIPCNYMWYILLPCWFTKLCMSLMFFLSVMYISRGSLLTIYNNIKSKEQNSQGKLVFAVIIELLGISINVIQLMIAI